MVASIAPSSHTLVLHVNRAEWSQNLNPQSNLLTAGPVSTHPAWKLTWEKKFNAAHPCFTLYTATTHASHEALDRLLQEIRG